MDHQQRTPEKRTQHEEDRTTTTPTTNKQTIRLAEQTQRINNHKTKPQETIVI